MRVLGAHSFTATCSRFVLAIARLPQHVPGRVQQLIEGKFARGGSGLATTIVSILAGLAGVDSLAAFQS